MGLARFQSFYLKFHHKFKIVQIFLSKFLGWIPLTFRSLLLIPLLIWIRQSYGIHRSDFVVLTLAEGGILLIGLSIIIVTIVALVLRFRSKPLVGDGYFLETDLPFHSDFKLKKISWVPWVNVEVEWKSPAGVESHLIPVRGELIEEILPRERGLTHPIIRRLKVIDLFGLSKIFFEESERRGVKISPRLGKMQSTPLFKQFGSGDFISHPLGEPMGDRVDLRRYVRGDPLKHILWKIYARSRRLMVREIELAISPEHKIFIYLIASKNDEAVASLTRTALEKRIFGANFVFLADGEQTPTSHLHEAVEQIIASSRAKEKSAEGLSSFLRHAHAEGVNGCVVFASGESSSWVDRFLETIQQNRIEIYLILVVRNFSSDLNRSFIHSYLLESGRVEKKQIQTIKYILEKLSPHGVRISLIDSVSGRNLTL